MCNRIPSWYAPLAFTLKANKIDGGWFIAHIKDAKAHEYDQGCDHYGHQTQKHLTPAHFFFKSKEIDFFFDHLSPKNKKSPHFDKKRKK
jgi:hypothetical protein